METPVQPPCPPSLRVGLVWELPSTELTVIVPAFNAALFLPETLQSLADQTFESQPFARCVATEVSFVDDNSTDDTFSLLLNWRDRLVGLGYRVLLQRNDGTGGKGAGYARNLAVRQSSGVFIACLDADDLMRPTRLQQQLLMIRKHPCAIVGCKFDRFPAGATSRYTTWANQLTSSQLHLQAFRELTLIQPSWMFSRATYDRVGGYDSSPGCPEDMIFWYKHLSLGGELRRVDEVLLSYRYHDGETSRKIHRLSLLQLRLEAFQRMVLDKWQEFSVWGCGRDGRKFFMSLSEQNQRKVRAFLEVDEAKIAGSPYVNCWTQQKVPVVHFRACRPPVVVCVGLEGRGTALEDNLRLAGLVAEREGVDFHMFN